MPIHHRSLPVGFWEWGCRDHITRTAGKGRGTGKRGKRRDLAMKIMVDKQLGDETSASERTLSLPH